MGLDGKYVYLGGCGDAFLGVASTATNRLVRRIGPLNGPGVRPFTINGSQTLAFTTSKSFLGFQVSSITTGRVLFSVAPPGFTFYPAAFGDSTPDHGISLSPNERQLYLIDTPNGYRPRLRRQRPAGHGTAQHRSYQAEHRHPATAGSSTAGTALRLMSGVPAT